MFRRIKAIYAASRAKGKYKKEIEEKVSAFESCPDNVLDSDTEAAIKDIARRESEMESKLIKPVLKSKTTQNIAVGGGSVMAVFAFIRTMWPDTVPWTADNDAIVAAFLSTILVPLISRGIAAVRK